MQSGDRLTMLLSVATRLGLGAFPIVFLLALRWAHGKDSFDLAAAALNWATYLNILLLGGFAMVPPALARLRAGASVPGGDDDARLVRDHVALCRWLTLAAAGAALGMLPLIDSAFPELAQRHGTRLQGWYTLMAVMLLAQIPLTLWLGTAQALGDYREAFAWTVLPRLAAVLAVAVSGLNGAAPDVSVAAAVACLLAGQVGFTLGVRRRLRDRLPTALQPGDRSAGRVLALNLTSGAVGLVGAGVSIVPVTLIGHAAPDATGAAQVIVGLSNAVSGLVAAAYFPMSLTLGIWLRQPGGLTRYCLRIALTVGTAAAALAAAVATSPFVLRWMGFAGPNEAIWTAALVLAGAGLRLGALGTQHLGSYARRPAMNLTSASIESVLVMALCAWLVEELGLIGLGAAILVGGASRTALAMTLERSWLLRAVRH